MAKASVGLQYGQSTKDYKKIDKNASAIHNRQLKGGLQRRCAHSGQRTNTLQTEKVHESRAVEAESAASDRHTAETTCCGEKGRTASEYPEMPRDHLVDGIRNRQGENQHDHNAQAAHDTVGLLLRHRDPAAGDRHTLGALHGRCGGCMAGAPAKVGGDSCGEARSRHLPLERRGSHLRRVCVRLSVVGLLLLPCLHCLQIWLGFGPGRLAS
mmetsp:Transcript_21130/g.67342  ORF Transcript_21130/g.67342 Transcript_21130/m.67342 type:complete len:212 (+) Transcript_21130:1960-2595(+)